MTKSIAIFYLFAILLATLFPSVSSMGSSNCINIEKKWRNTHKSLDDKHVELASHREGEKVTQMLDQSDESRSTNNRRRSPPKQEQLGWARMFADPMTQHGS